MLSENACALLYHQLTGLSIISCFLSGKKIDQPIEYQKGY